MVSLFGLAALIVPVLGARVEVHDQARSATFRGLELLEQLKKTPTDVNLQNEYSELIGEVEFHESRVFLETGAQIQQEPVSLGENTASGLVLNMAEMTGFFRSLGRFLTNRRDYVFEEDGGNSKYALDGRTLSLHTRMFVSIVGESDPRFLMRRAFSYLNPLAGLFGQFVYRVIQCTEPSDGGRADGECSEGDVLYTITKDRLGRGALWGMDEYRVYTGKGGCSRWASGIVSCHQGSQVLYSLGAGLTEATFDTAFYAGNIIAVDGSGEAGLILDNGSEVRVNATELAAMKIARSTKTEGPPRWLNWMSPVVPFLGVGLEFVKAAIWSDKYQLTFEGVADELLVCLMAAAQDLTRDTINIRTVAAAGGVAAGAAIATLEATPLFMEHPEIMEMLYEADRTGVISPALQAAIDSGEFPELGGMAQNVVYDHFLRINHPQIFQEATAAINGEISPALQAAIDSGDHPELQGYIQYLQNWHAMN